MSPRVNQSRTKAVTLHMLLKRRSLPKLTVPSPCDDGSLWAGSTQPRPMNDGASILVDCLPTFVLTGIATFLFWLALLSLMEPYVVWWALAQWSRHVLPEHPVPPRAHPRRPKMSLNARRQGERRPHGKRCHSPLRGYGSSSSDSDCAGDDTRLSVLDPFERPRHRTEAVPERRRIVRRPVRADDDDSLTPSQARQLRHYQRQLAARQVDFTDAHTWDFISSATIPETSCPFTPPILQRHAEGARSAKPDELRCGA